MNKRDEPCRSLVPGRDNDKIVDKILSITARGHHAKVKRTREGFLTVYDVKEELR